MVGSLKGTPTLYWGMTVCYCPLEPRDDLGERVYRREGRDRDGRWALCPRARHVSGRRGSLKEGVMRATMTEANNDPASACGGLAS